jgi:hypothetical protein
MLRAPWLRQRPVSTLLVYAARANWAREDATSCCPPARTVNGKTSISYILLDLVLMVIPLRLGRQCHYDVDLSFAGDRKTIFLIRRMCPLPSGVRDISSLSVRERQRLPFLSMESRHDSQGGSEDKLILQPAKPRQIRKRRRPVTVCQRCRYVRKKCNRELPTCSYCQK